MIHQEEFGTQQEMHKTTLHILILFVTLRILANINGPMLHYLMMALQTLLHFRMLILQVPYT